MAKVKAEDFFLSRQINFLLSIMKIKYPAITNSRGVHALVNILNLNSPIMKTHKNCSEC